MIRQPFTNSSSQTFSRVTFGTWRLLNDPAVSTPQDVLALLKTCLDVGITTIDTAEIYGLYRVEEMLGQALALDSGVRRRMEIITKFGIYVPCEFHPERHTAFYNADGQRAVKSVEKSLRLLGAEALDVVLVHRPDWLGDPADTAAGLQQLVDSGKVKAVGVSNYSPSQFSALQQHLGVPLVTNQLEFSPFQLASIFDGTFDQCLQHGLRPMAWSPTGGGRLFGSGEEASRVKAAFASFRENVSAFAELGDDTLCHAWILRHSTQPFTILGTTKKERILSAAKAAAAAEHFTKEMWYAVTEAGRGSRIP